MDSLALVKQHTALAILFLALHHISSMPYGGRQAMAIGPFSNTFPYLPFYQQVQQIQQMYNPFPSMPIIQPLQPRPIYVANPIPAPLPSRGIWNYQMYRKLPKVISKPKKRISVFGGPLNNVMPYPNKGHTHMLMKQKRKSKMHSVAKAKSFSGIIKNTALDTGKM